MRPLRPWASSLENVAYVFENGVATAFIRAFVSVPGHAFWAIIGYYLGEAKVRHQPSLALRGLVIAVFLHGLFDRLALEISGDGHHNTRWTGLDNLLQNCEE